MTVHKRNVVEHRMLKVRQNPTANAGGLGAGTGNASIPDEVDGGNEGAGNGNASPPTESSSSISKPDPTPSSSSVAEKSSSSSSVPPSSSHSSSTEVQTSTRQVISQSETSTSTSATSSATSTATSSSAGSTSSSSSSSSDTSSSSSVTTSSIVPTITSAPPTTTTTTGRRAQTSSFASVSRTSLDGDSTVVASALPSNEASGSLGTGAIVGSVVGAIAGLAVVGMIIMFCLRRYNKRSRRSVLYPTDFRSSNAFPSDSANAPEFPQMGQRGHGVAPSISGPGIAGMGAGAYGATETSTPVADPSAIAAATAAAKAALQERPKYTYGQDTGYNNNQNASHQQHVMDDHDTNSDIAHGVYSSEPQMQVSYNPEAYSSYATYGNGAGAGYQDAQREYQAQQGYQGHPQQGYQGYDQNGYYDQQHGQQGSYDYVVDGAPPVPPQATAHGSNVGASKRAINTRSVVNDEDVYGGI